MTKLRPLVLALGLLTLAAQAQLKIPPLSGPVIDQAGLLDGSQLQSLSAELRRYPPELQLQVWIVPSLQGEPIESLSIRAVEAWKLGQAKTDRGALLLLATEDRSVRLEIGQGLEGDIPDALSGRITDGLAPYFREGRFADGITWAARNAYKLAGGNLDKLGYPDESLDSHGSLRLILMILFFLFFGFYSFFLAPRMRGGRFGGGGFGGWGGGGGFGGGGGWSGGGGGFSGGGSSGRW